MFEAQTYDKVLEEILSRAPDGIDLRQGSIFYDAVAGIAFKIAKYYADLEQVFEMVFLVTATGDYLTLKAEEYAVYRQAAATAKYRIKYDGELPELGTRFFCSGQYFVLAQDDALGIYIEAEKAGTEANDIPAGTSVVPTDTQRSLTACSIVEELEPGADDEDDESLRKRVQEKIAGPAENGNQQHYKTWCESISGVGRARIVPLWAGENTVKGVLIDTEGGPASEAVVQRVQEYIDPGGTGLGEGQANIGAHFTATSATAKRVNISFSVTLAKGGDLASVRSAAQTALKAQIKSINLTTDDSETPTLRISTVGNTIYSLLGVLDYANLRFNGQTANVEAGKEEVFVLGEVTVSETNPVSYRIPQRIRGAENILPGVLPGRFRDGRYLARSRRRAGRNRGRRGRCCQQQLRIPDGHGCAGADGNLPRYPSEPKAHPRGAAQARRLVLHRRQPHRFPGVKRYCF